MGRQQLLCDAVVRHYLTGTRKANFHTCPSVPQPKVAVDLPRLPFRAPSCHSINQRKHGTTSYMNKTLSVKFWCHAAAEWFALDAKCYTWSSTNRRFCSSSQFACSSRTCDDCCWQPWSDFATNATTSHPHAAAHPIAYIASLP